MSSETKISPGWAEDSKREAVFTTSPKMSFFSRMHSPVWMPILARRRVLYVLARLMSSMPRWMSQAARQAASAPSKCESEPSPIVFTSVPPWRFTAMRHRSW